MRYTKWIGLAAAVLLTVSCFTPWVIINETITVSGVDATGTNYGKPGYFHLLLIPFFILCTLIPRLGAKRANLIVVALNIAWAVRNYFILSSCQGGECPEKQTGLYLTLLASAIMFITALFPDMKLPVKKQEP